MSAGPVYRRSHDGRTVHRQGCRHYQAGVRWAFADRMTEEEVRRQAALYPWLRLCRRCWPAAPAFGLA